MNQIEISKMLLCIDGSDLSKNAAILAISVAKKYRSKLYALSAYNIPDLHDLYLDQKDVIHIELDNKAKKTNELLETITKDAKEAGVNMQPVFLNTKLSPEDAIIEFAEKENVDMIFLGSTGTSTLKKILIGSVASTIVTKAKAIVTVVK